MGELESTMTEEVELKRERDSLALLPIAYHIAYMQMD